MQNNLYNEHILPKDPVALEYVNKYIYVKQNFIPTLPQPEYSGSKVLINPLFNKKVFVNPNFHAPMPPSSTKIHINPRLKTSGIENFTNSNIHINPEVLRNIPVMENNFCTNIQQNQVNTDQTSKSTITTTERRVRRTSIRSKFKIVRSTYSNSSRGNVKPHEKYTRTLLNNRYSLNRKTPSSQTHDLYKSTKISKYKVDNRKSKHINLTPKNKFVFVNRFLSIGELANNVIFKTTKSRSSLINLRGTLFKNSPNSLRRASIVKKTSSNIFKVQNKSISRYKYSRKTLITSPNGNMVYVNKRLSKVKNNISVEKLKKCNIPCQYYRKFGRCKGNKNGKCKRKHDPDQIALCTKFLQGACVDKKCLLSHNVSPEKMPTCKFYLEGLCSREDCPYLHVRISPKADICRDFLEGFCKKATKCDKRHQFLCPDYEKQDCAKIRCPYPHGNMVRKYSLVNRNKFAKKSSDYVKAEPSEKFEKDVEQNCTDEPVTVNKRYYIDRKASEEQNIDNSDNNIDAEGSAFRSRPKLGKLPSFIAFEEL